ncbi:MAG: ACT domain-containing protein [Planctomycetes bacterium]|nr:ACT domain-containing protein [Planctomycetota bacterium]
MPKASPARAPSSPSACPICPSKHRRRWHKTIFPQISLPHAKSRFSLGQASRRYIQYLLNLTQESIMAKRKKASQVCILTVTGKDKVGIIARIANTMAKANINIIDVSQKIMDEYFVMSLACDIAEAIIDLPNIQKQLQKIAKDMDLNITFQHENIFKMMHRV